jgi:periplasmic divalent cation tolerance protein
VCDEGEALCIIKTRRELYDRLRDRVTALHPYDVPEILGFAAREGNEPYLRWIADSTA